jgi:hypothetical protein
LFSDMVRAALGTMILADSGGLFQSPPELAA